MRSRGAAPSLPLLCWAIALARQGCRVANAQIYSFEDVAIPANRSLHTLYAFYVYSQEEAPAGSNNKPFVKFSHFKARFPKGGRDKDIMAYEGLQLSLMRYRDFWDLINPQKFCSTWSDVQAGRSEKPGTLLVQKPLGSTYSSVDVYLHTIRFQTSADAHPRDNKTDVKSTGVYILVFSNCGDIDEGFVDGTVLVKNSYGFLPGNEYHKMPFYGWLLLVYVGMAVIWLGLSIRWWKELFNIQNCIAFVIFFGLLESFLWYIFYNDWNNTGVRGKFLFVAAILLTVLKSTLSYMLVLVASLGWGVTRPYLDQQVMVRLQVLCFFYVVLDFIRESVLLFRHSHSLSLAFVLLCLLPVSLLNGAIFYWVFTALSSLMDTLKERGQGEKLLLFQRLWKILILALSVATMTLLFQIFNLSRDVTSRWKHQWLLTDGVSHGLFLFVLAAMMYLWAPHKYSQRYAYSTQISGHEQEMGLGGPERHGNTVWADEDEDENDDADSFWATTHGRDADEPKAPADVIGASSGDRL
mmetsp:Transcript_49387/g.152314  ORF Transcript_49387/g.152314 Transcript_49387/m.152314 type:complete len:524 (-) Transcript_49387:61-1632(-)